MCSPEGQHCSTWKLTELWMSVPPCRPYWVRHSGVKPSDRQALWVILMHSDVWDPGNRWRVYNVANKGIYNGKGEKWGNGDPNSPTKMRPKAGSWCIKPVGSLAFWNMSLVSCWEQTYRNDVPHLWHNLFNDDQLDSEFLMVPCRETQGLPNC